MKEKIALWVLSALVVAMLSPVVLPCMGYCSISNECLKSANIVRVFSFLITLAFGAFFLYPDSKSKRRKK